MRAGNLDDRLLHPSVTRAFGWTILLLSIGLAGFAVHSRGALAQTWPAKPVRVIVSYPPGGATDIVARLVTQKASELLGQSFVIENRGGAQGTIGTDAVAKSSPDGYVFLLSGGVEHTLMHLILDKLSYDSPRDLAPIMLLASAPAVMVTHRDSGLRSFKEMIEFTRKQPGGLSFGTPGIGSPNEEMMRRIGAWSGTSFVHVPFKGGAPAVQAIVANQLPIAVVNAPVAISQIRAGVLRPLAVIADGRSSLMPDVPTVKELSGIERAEPPAWFGMFAPAKTRADILNRIETTLRSVVEDAEIRKAFAEQGLEAGNLSGTNLAKYILEERAVHAAIQKRITKK